MKEKMKKGMTPCVLEIDSHLMSLVTNLKTKINQMNCYQSMPHIFNAPGQSPLNVYIPLAFPWKSNIDFHGMPRYAVARSPHINQRPSSIAA